MRFEYLFVFLLGQLCHHHVTCDDEALRECANIHHISIQVISNVHATFTNHKCLLNCLVDNKTLASDPINEGVACPLDSTGICKNGQCIGGREEAIGECGKLHSLDFHLVRNSGTQYANSLCQLKCVIDGNVIGLHGVNEGLQCPKDFNGVCRNGQCVTISETKPTITPTTAPIITPTRTPTTQNPSPQSVPIEVTFDSAHSQDLHRSVFQVQICFHYNKTLPFSWNSCDLSWTSGIILEEIKHREKCFTILRHSPHSELAFRYFHDSNLYEESHWNFETDVLKHILEKRLDNYSPVYVVGYFSTILEYQQMH